MRAILGTQDFGGRLNLKMAQEVLETFIKYNPESKVVVDTSRLHDMSEKCLGEIEDAKRANVLLSTKASPWKGEDLSYNGVLKQFETSLKNLQLSSSLHTFYLHAPDYRQPVAESLRAVDHLYRGGKIREFGLCNFAAWQVAEICTLCKSNSWVAPTVYQGMYNCFTRMVESELMPCLKHFGISFYAYNTLCYGLLSGKYNFEDFDTQGDKEGKFFSLDFKGDNVKRFWKKNNFISIEKIQKALTEVYGENVVPLPQASLRWLCFHSQLDSQKGDGLLLGVSSPDQIRQNMAALKAGKLHDQVVEAFDQGWASGQNSCPKYMK